MRKRKKRGSVFSGLLVFVLLAVVACTVAVNLIFSGERVPRIAGYYLYLQETDDMSPAIPEKSLVAAESAVISELHEGNKVLCYLADGTLALRNIYKIEETEDGTVNYYPGTVAEQGTDLVIPRTNIFAVCVWASPQLYQYILFATSVSGLMILLVAPCVLLIIMLLTHIARNGESMDDEEFSFEEESHPKKKKKVTESPLYDPEKSAPEMLEEKKSSISENFSAKPVNENSPYQKAVQEREKTMKFRRQEIEAEALRALEEPYPRQKNSHTHIYSSEEVRKQAKLQAQQQIPSLVRPAEPAPPAEPEPIPEKSVQEEPKPVSVPEKKPEPQKPAKPVYSSPNIDDILKPSELKSAQQKKNSAISSTDSIDALIRALEKEKDKL